MTVRRRPATISPTRTVVVALALAASGAAAHAAQQAPAASPPPVAAATPAGEWNPRSGDAWIDRQLGDINLYAGRYRGAFLDELVRYHAAPRALVTELLVERHWAPGDIYYACAVAQIAGRPCRGVVDAWAQGGADGWQTVAARTGLAPDAMARVKKAIVDSYARWGRPLAKPAPAPDKPAVSRKTKTPSRPRR